MVQLGLILKVLLATFKFNICFFKVLNIKWLFQELRLCEAVTSNVATLTVNSAAISQNPVDFTACSEGANTATFSVTTTGEVTGYQWQNKRRDQVGQISLMVVFMLMLLLLLYHCLVLALVNNGWQFRCVINEAVISEFNYIKY